ncbi:MAG: hypothetical protein IPP72_01040 [Chitinophagaceae bacterium]|nr:hypothetical protein [Chitinophagaceae bacterium]
MKTGWKIFRAANIVEIVMVIAILVLLFVSNNFSLKSTEDVIGISVCSFVVGVITWNCISNFLLLKASNTNNHLSFSKRLLFWFTTVLFFLACIFIIFCILASYPMLAKKVDGRKYEYYGVIVMILWMLIIALTGLFIFIRQIQLFLKITRMHKEISMKLVAEIGEL